jgi:hypothetical protein
MSTGGLRLMAYAGPALGALSAVAGCGRNNGLADGGTGPQTQIVVVIDVEVARCPLIGSILVVPPAVPVGGSVDLFADIGLAPANEGGADAETEAGLGAEAGDDGGAAMTAANEDGGSEGGDTGSDGAQDADAEPIMVSWSASSGQFGDASAAETTFTCTAVGSVMVTLTVTHQGCSATVSVPVDCLGTEGGPNGP